VSYEPDFKLGVSVYSYTGDFGVVMDLEDCAEDIADLGATGIEILGEGHVLGYPEPSTAWVDGWHALVGRLGLAPTLFGSWLDTRRHVDRSMTVEEGTAQLRLDLELASRLGFAFVRPKIGVVTEDLVPDPIWAEVVERNLDLASDRNIVICPEIHWPTPIRSQAVDDYLALIERTGTTNFGLLIDTGVFQLSHHHRTEPGLRSQLGVGELPAFPNPPVVPVSHLREVMDHVVYFQAKFHEIDDDLVDHHIPWAEILDVVAEAGFTGWLSSEYEGDRLPYRASDQLRRQHALIRTLAGSRVGVRA
jgi:sugar phosphate isomerase/epimerase